jgi:hypothetical protein
MSLHDRQGIVNTTDCTGIFRKAMGKTGIISVYSANIPPQGHTKYGIQENY